MQRTLGILVTTERHIDYVLRLTDAAMARNKKVEIFFTGKAVMLTKHPEFKKLAEKASVSLCDISFRASGLSGPVQGVISDDFVTQAKNAEMIEKCDRYVVF